MPSYDAIVLGLGGMGAATLYELAQRGLRVLGIEQHGVAHDQGSSHGRTRIIRKAYFEHPDYVPLLHRTYEAWHALEAATGKRLFHRTGLLMLGVRDGIVIPGVKRAAVEHGLDFESLPIGEVSARFPVFVPDEDMEALFERDAGYLVPEDCVRTYVEQACARHAAVHAGERVVGWESDGQNARVTTDGDTYGASHLVLCAGPWAGYWLADLSVPLEIRRKVVLWFRAESRELTADAGFPVFCVDTRDGFFYGFPSLDEGEMKIGEHTGGQTVTDPASIDRDLFEDDMTGVRSFVRRHLRGVADHVVRHTVCMYTMTPDEHFIIDRHPRSKNVVFAAGFSGHGFKFAPVVASALADLIEHGRTGLPIGFLSLDRFKS